MEKTFKGHLLAHYPKEEVEALLSEIEKEENRLSCCTLDIEKLDDETFLSQYPSALPHPVTPHTFLFSKEKLDLGKSLLFEMGAFYIFEPCSALCAYFLNPQKEDFILDIAAAPGGKCIHTSFCMQNEGQIIANEVSFQRAEILSSNVEKFGRKNIIVTSVTVDKLARQFPHTFSKIILDAPCSGSGMFRKSKEMKEDWTYEKVLSCARTQKELIRLAYQMLSPGGELLYSTCSFSYEEDEEVLRDLLMSTDAILCPLPSIKGEYRLDIPECIHLLPHRYQGEGHFYAKIRKPGTITNSLLPNKIPNKYKSNMKSTEYGNLIKIQENLYLSNYIIDLSGISILRYGLKVGSYDAKKNFIPDHAYARYAKNILPKISLSEVQAKQYIFGLPLTLSSNIKGYVALTHQNISFAISKNSNMLKNHYPKGLRKTI